MSTIYGPQLPTRGDVQAARERAWDALAADVNGPESIQAFDDYMATVRAAGARDAQTEAEATEVTRLDGTRFVPRDINLEGLALTYRPRDGYSLRPVAGEHRDHGFKITEYLDKEAGQ